MTCLHAATAFAPSRRALLLGGGAVAVLAAGSLGACSPAAETAAPLPPPDPTLVATEYGSIRGVQTDGVLEFRGVRYAQPPVGPLRFQAPRKLEPWQGEVAAQEHGQPAVQMRAGAGAAAYPPPVQAAMSEAFAPPPNAKAGGDEDCLVLDVYTQKAGPDAGAVRPVMVWLHGGGFSYGQAPLAIYRGHNLAKNHDVVFVGVNHRLNIFGFLGLDSLGLEGFEGSANAGMLDIVMALEWVRNNIVQFGGDPSNVTIFGQSGGGAKVSALLAMPNASGLFHKAIIQSGAGLRVGETQDAADAASQLLIGLGISASQAPTMLGDIPVEDILDVAADIGAGKFRPSLDMLNIPRHPFDPAAPQQSVNIPVMIGFTKDEQTLYNVGNPAWLKTTDKQVLAAAEKVAKGEGAAIVADFKAAFPDYDAPHLLMQVTGTVNALRSHHTLAARKAAQPAPVYAYIFAHDIPPDDFVLKAPHTAEIPYIMDNVAVSPLFAGRAEEDHVMGRMMSAAWVNFARTGDPNTEGLPQWPRFNPDTRPTMFLSTDPRVVESPFPEVWRVIQANPAANPRPT